MHESVPVIDVAEYLAGSPGALDAVAAQVREALTEIGFFVLTGHDVPASLIERTFAEAKRFHDLPMTSKVALKLNEHNNGYMAIARYAVWTSEVNKNDQPDLNEAFFVKRERAPDHPLRLSGRRFVGPNLWPEEAALPGFRANVLAYAETMDGLARRFLPAVAAALDLEPGWFDCAFDDSQFSFRLSHYPPVEAAANQFGIAPHTDSNFMTFLAQTEVPGLQVRMPSGNWRDVPYIRGSFAVNSGDMLKRWSNGRFKSTPHRALPPVGQSRYAIPFFLGPNFDQIIACLPTCTDAKNPPRWPPIAYAEWQTYWYDANYDPKAQRDVA
ncbi:MAG: isopenicillin N synthase family oxygenase [Alphaproteobacteria bacterium]|nr:isopenicillin N synthase family oxygenase [Alphaproteobacteria bacterium]